MRKVLLFVFWCGISSLWGQKVFLTSGNSFVMPSTAIAAKMIETDSGFVALFQNQKVSGSYQFFLVFLNKDLEYQSKVELENAAYEYYNDLDYQFDTLRIFSAKSSLINDKEVVEYGYRIYDFKLRKVRPAYKKLAVREALPSLHYPYNEMDINPFQYHLLKLHSGYHLYYLQKKKVKSVDYTYLCVKVLDTSFNVVNYFQKEITPFENLKIANFITGTDFSGVEFAIKENKESSTYVFYTVLTRDSMWVSDIASKKFFCKHFLAEKKQFIGVVGGDKPESAYFYNSQTPKDSMLLESVFGNFNYQYNFEFHKEQFSYFPYLDKSSLFSIHNLYIANWNTHHSVMLPYYCASYTENAMFIVPVFWEEVCLIYGKLNSKNFYQDYENPVYTVWNYKKQSIVKEFFFNEPYSLILWRPFLKSEKGAYFLGKYKNRFMFYRLEISQNG